MEILESLAYIALGFIPMLALLEVGYRMGMKIRRRKGLVARSVLSPTKSLLPCFQDMNLGKYYVVYHET